jgi:anti-sigma factor RsiW
MSNRSHEHVSAERLQALLDGTLPSREVGQVEEHVAACAGCSEELESWRVLFEDLSALPRLGPTRNFRDRVMATVELPSRAPLTERLRRRLAAFLPSPRPEHPAGERLQDFLDGALPVPQVARIATHLEACAACASEVDAWRAVYARLGGLETYAPSAGFTDRVMAAVRVPVIDAATATTRPATLVESPARARGLSALHLPDWRRALVGVGRFVPKTRRAWAALAGVALTPAVTLGLVLYTVFSHPTLTPQALASFALWKVTELVAAAWTAAPQLVLDAGQTMGVDALFRALLDAPFMLAGGALAYSAVSALALRVLYKNLSAQRSHARLSHS